MCSSHINTYAHGCFVHSWMSCASFSYMLQQDQTPTSYPDSTTSALRAMHCHRSQHGTMFFQSQQYLNWVFILLFPILCSVLFLFYISCYFCDLHTSLSLIIHYASVHPCYHQCLVCSIAVTYYHRADESVVIHCFSLSKSTVMTSSHYYSQFTNYPCAPSSDPHSQQCTSLFVLRLD